MYEVMPDPLVHTVMGEEFQLPAAVSLVYPPIPLKYILLLTHPEHTLDELSVIVGVLPDHHMAVEPKFAITFAVTIEFNIEPPDIKFVHELAIGTPVGPSTGKLGEKPHFVAISAI